MKQTRLNQVVDIIGGADAVAQAVQIVDGSQNVGHGNGTADQLVVVAAQHFLLLFHIRSGIEDLLDLVEGAALVDAALLDIEGEEALSVNTAIGDDLATTLLPSLRATSLLMSCLYGSVSVMSSV